MSRTYIKSSRDDLLLFEGGEWNWNIQSVLKMIFTKKWTKTVKIHKLAKIANQQ